MKLPLRAGQWAGYPAILDADGACVASCVNPDAQPTIVRCVNAHDTRATAAILHELAHMDPEEDNVRALGWLIDRAREALWLPQPPNVFRVIYNHSTFDHDTEAEACAQALSLVSRTLPFRALVREVDCHGALVRTVTEYGPEHAEVAQ